LQISHIITIIDFPSQKLFIIFFGYEK